MLRQMWASLLLVITLFSATAVMVAGQAEETPAVIEVAAFGANENEEARVDVNIDGARNVGAFEFVLVFDDQVLEVARVERGPFIAQSGREVFCLDPVIEPGAMRYECLTLGDTPATGSDGSGTLASVFLRSKGNGESPVQLTRAKIADPMGTDMPLTVIDDSLQVFGDNEGWIAWWIIAVVGAAVVVFVAAVVAVVVRRRGGASPEGGAEFGRPGGP